MLLYLDESGNTGSNWLDVKQPYFVYGGWLIKNDKKDLAENVLLSCFSNYKANELKSQKIWDRKRLVLIEFINKMIDAAEAYPCFMIMDKKYMIAAEIVETFFDCNYNPFVNKEITLNVELKKALADRLSKNNVIIKEFAELIKNGTLDLKKFKSIKMLIKEDFKKISDQLAEIIEKLDDDSLVRMIEEFEIITENGTKKRWLSPVRMSLFERIECLDSFCTLTSEEGEIYVDELFGFNDIFGELNTIISNKGYYKNDIQISMCNSKNELLIQASDLLSGFITRSLTEVNKVSSSIKVNELWKKLVYLRECFLADKIIIWNYCAPDDFINLIGELVGSSCNKKYNSDNYIQENINKIIRY